jgi:protocatechuate 3,4-dioxygenase beta subunit
MPILFARQAKEKTMERRNLLKNAGILLGSITALKAQSLAQCGLTPRQVKGPFYPVREMEEVDADLSKTIHGTAIGQKVIIKGKVTDHLCRPLKNVLVEVWQACHTGKYDHPEDTFNADLDPNFQYFARLKTDQDGNYSFKTIIPGSYPATSTWVRPPHIHFRVVAPGHPEFITQMYFKGHVLNDSDQILRQLSKEDQNKLVIEFKPIIEGDDLLTGNFNIALINRKNLKNFS